ncbi:MAG: hypothetical protein RIF32_06470 [Leptospirales bacterium]|jgi:hypothetical protein
MHPSDDSEILNNINKIQGADRKFFFEMLMHMNGCHRGVAEGLYPLLADSARACVFLYQRQRTDEIESRERFATLQPADAFRFVQIMEHFARDPQKQPLALSDFLELLAQEPESLREFLSLSDEEKTTRFEALLEGFYSRDADFKSSLDSISEAPKANPREELRGSEPESGSADDPESEIV